jgi:hypothetical protein
VSERWVGFFLPAMRAPGGLPKVMADRVQLHNRTGADKNPKASRQELARQIHAISGDTHLDLKSGRTVIELPGGAAPSGTAPRCFSIDYLVAIICYSDRGGPIVLCNF